MRNVFDTILEFGHDEDFVPVENNDFRPTSAPAGSVEKLAILARRVEHHVEVDGRVAPLAPLADHPGPGGVVELREIVRVRRGHRGFLAGRVVGEGRETGRAGEVTSGGTGR